MKLLHFRIFVVIKEDFKKYVIKTDVLWRHSCFTERKPNISEEDIIIARKNITNIIKRENKERKRRRERKKEKIINVKKGKNTQFKMINNLATKIVSGRQNKGDEKGILLSLVNYGERKEGKDIKRRQSLRKKKQIKLLHLLFLYYFILP